MGRNKIDIETILEEGNNVLNIGDRKIVIPKDWTEIDRKYLLAFCQGVFLGFETGELLQFVLLHANNLSSYVEEKIKLAPKSQKEDILSNVYRASESLNFMFDCNGLGFDKIPSFKSLITPQKGLTDFKMLEFVTAQTFFNSFIKSNNRKDLDNFCAVILREKCKGVRKPFSEGEMKNSERYLKHLSIVDKLAIFKMYEGELNELFKTYDKVFDSSGEDVESSFPYDLITSCAGEKFGTVDEVEQRDIHIILQWKQRQIEEYNKETEKQE